MRPSLGRGRRYSSLKLAEAGPHVNHAAARQEWLAHDEHAYISLAVQVKFTQVHRDMRPRYYAALPP